ncbi:MAG: D-alanyl-D-alanine carboxypeptidase family protein [Candidatus Saccharibacteria bacterium]|nr:D-alanyl-D-alanine carboxypeptidase family protein [Candidatus Saccharibacteria bacterium]
MAVEDKEKSGSKEEITPDFLREATGINPEQEQTMDREAHSGAAKDIAEREGIAGTQKTTEADKAESDRIGTPDGQIGGGYKANAKKKRKFWTKKKGVGAGIAGLAVFGGMGLFGIMSGPFGVMHFGQLLNLNFLPGNSILTSRAGNLYKWSQWSDQPEMRRLGAIGRQSMRGIDAKFERAGYRKVVGSGGRLHAVIAPNNERIPVDPPGTGKSAAKQNWRRVVRRVNLVSTKRIGPVGSRFATRAYGMNMGNILNPRRTLQDWQAKRTRVREARQANKTGTQPADVRTTADDADVDRAPGDPDPNEGTGRQNTTSRRNTARAIKTASGIALGCIAIELADPEGVAHKTNVILPLIRGAGRYLTIMGQLQSGNVDHEELGIVYQELVADNEDGEPTSAFASAPMQHLAGRAPTGRDIPPEAHPVRSKNFFENIMGGVWSSIEGVQGPISAGCQHISSTVGQIIGGGIDIALCAVSGGATCVARGAIQTALIGGGMHVLVNILAGEQTAACFSETVEELDEEDTEVAGNTPVGGDIVGACAGYGARIFANENMLNFGGTQLSDEEFAAVQRYSNELETERFQNQSLFARLFSPYEHKSLFSNVARNTLVFASGNSGHKFAHSLLTAPFGITQNLLQPFNSAVYAQDNRTFDWGGYPAYGFSIDELDDERFDNPFENASIVADRLDDSDVKDKIERCFALELQDDYSLKRIDDEVRSVHSLDGCDDQDEVWKRIRFYILDTQIAETMNCYEGDHTSCRTIGFDVANAESEQSTSRPAPDEAIVGDTSDQPCASGTDDLGTATGYNNGDAYTIRLCSIPGFTSEWPGEEFIRINSTVSGNWLNLFQAARTDGIDLQAVNSFRSMERQQVLYDRYLAGRGNLAAQPGHSNHQLGFAVDIVMDDRGLNLEQCRANAAQYPIFSWLRDNSSDFGIEANVPDECWHWSS